MSASSRRVSRRNPSRSGRTTPFRADPGGLGAGAGVRYTGTSYGNDTNTFSNDPITLVDAAFHYDFGGINPKLKGLSAQINATNLLDENYNDLSGRLLLSRQGTLRDRRHALPMVSGMGSNARSLDRRLQSEPAAFLGGGRHVSRSKAGSRSPLDLEIGAGRMTALIGHNGSGKSTLLKMLARQEDTERRPVLFGGRSTAAWPTRDFARAVAYLPQSPQEAVGLTVRELVMFGRYPWHGALGRVTEADRTKVAEALEATGTARSPTVSSRRCRAAERQRAGLRCSSPGQAASCCSTSRSPLSIYPIKSTCSISFGGSRGSAGSACSRSSTTSTWRRASATRVVALKGGRLIARGTPDEVVEATTSPISTASRWG